MVHLSLMTKISRLEIRITDLDYTDPNYGSWLWIRIAGGRRADLRGEPGTTLPP